MDNQLVVAHQSNMLDSVDTQSNEDNQLLSAGEGDNHESQKLSGNQKIQKIIDGFTEMVAFLDFSFDKALSEKDKAFMVAYREHIRQV